MGSILDSSINLNVPRRSEWWRGWEPSDARRSKFVSDGRFRLMKEEDSFFSESARHRGGSESASQRVLLSSFDTQMTEACDCVALCSSDPFNPWN